MANELRKLGDGEGWFDIVTRQGSLIMVGSILFESDINLFEHKPELNKAIQTWKSIHPFLRVKIITKKNENGKEEKYFAYASDEKINGLDNVEYLRLESDSDKADDYWVLLLERALNMKPVDSDNGLLWRLVLAKLKGNRYCLTLTMHHSVSDGLNSIALKDQLLSLIDESISGTLDPAAIKKFPVGLPAEELINSEDVQLPSDTSHIQEAFKDASYTKIHSNLAPKSRLPSLLVNDTDRFVYENEDKLNESLLIKDLVLSESQYMTKLKPIIIDENTVGKLLAKCRSQNAKLTGCISVIAALASRDLYTHYDCQNWADTILVNMMTNLRPIKKLGNLEMGCWALFPVKVKVDLKDVNEQDKDFYKSKFWLMAKHEHESLHKRIDDKEPIKNAMIIDSIMKKNGPGRTDGDV